MISEENKMKTEKEIRTQIFSLISCKDEEDNFETRARIDAGIRTLKWVLGEL